MSRARNRAMEGKLMFFRTPAGLRKISLCGAKPLRRQSGPANNSRGQIRTKPHVWPYESHKRTRTRERREEHGQYLAGLYRMPRRAAVIDRVARGHAANGHGFEWEAGMGIGIGHGGRIRRRPQPCRTDTPRAAAASLPSLSSLLPQSQSDRQQEQSWPLEVRLALFVLEAGADLAGEQACLSSPDHDPQQSTRTRPRRGAREMCRIRAKLVPLTNGAGPSSGTPHETANIYLRDTSDAFAGFICDQPLEIGAPFWLSLPTAVHDSAARSTLSDPPLHAAVKVCRCRPFMNGWYEGAIRLSEEAIPATNVGQPLLEVLRIAV
jgi:hypothetical protein